MKRMGATNGRVFSSHTPQFTKKSHTQSQKRSKVEMGGLYIEGKTMGSGEYKSETQYDPERYWHKAAGSHSKK